MRWNPRVGQANAVLVGLYLLHLGLGCRRALRTLLSPVFGLGDRVYLATAVFYNRLFDLGPEWVLERGRRVFWRG